MRNESDIRIFPICILAGLKPEEEIKMITQARSFVSFKKTSFNQYRNDFIIIANIVIQKLFLVVLLVVKLRASPFVLIDPSTGRAVEQVECG